jgi:hypothetical protein
MMKYIVLTLTVGCIIGALSGCSSPTQRSEAKAELVAARLEWGTGPDGKERQIVCVDWKNSGSTVIFEVQADIDLYDSSGKKLKVSAPRQTIYRAPKSGPGIAPGSVYHEPTSEGFLIVPTPRMASEMQPATRVAVRVTKASSVQSAL